MSTHKCKRCCHEFSTKSNLLQHLRRMNPCGVVDQDIDRGAYIIQLTTKEHSNEAVVCEHCHKQFNSRSSRNRHRASCTHKNDQQLKAVQEELSELRKLISTQASTNQTINNFAGNVNNGIVNNFNFDLRNFGDENMDAVPLDLVRSAFMFLEFKTIFENLHFDPNFPENRNVRMKSKKQEMLQIYKDNKWNTLHYSEGFRDIIRRIHTIFNDFVHKHKDKILQDMDYNELQHNLSHLEDIDGWLTDTRSKMRMILEAKQIHAFLDDQRSGVSPNATEAATAL